MAEATACEFCPWALANHGKRHPFGFYRKDNLTRLWNQIRRGGGGQSCHPTDASHPDHVASGAKLGAKVRECAGSIILVHREILKVIAFAPDGHTVGPEETDAYLASRKKGLTKLGLLYWMISRISCVGIPLLGGVPMPDVDVYDKRIALPVYLEG